MKLKKEKKNKTARVNFRCTEADLNSIQLKANLYTEGKLSEYIVYASKNFVASKEDFEEEIEES